MNYTDVDEQIKTLLADGTSKAFGLVTVPSARPVKPYGIVKPHTSPAPQGDMGSLTSNRDLVYAIQVIGEDAWQVRWMLGKVEEIMIAPATVAALGAQWVLPESTSAILPDGADQYSAVSNYCVRM